MAHGCRHPETRPQDRQGVPGRRPIPPRPRARAAIELGKLTPQAVTTMLRKKERAGLSPRSVAMIREVPARRAQCRDQDANDRTQRRCARGRPGKSRPNGGCPHPRGGQATPRRNETDRLAALYRLALTLGMRQAESSGCAGPTLTSTRRAAGAADVAAHPQRDRSSRNRRRNVAGGHWPYSPPLVAALIAHKDRQAFER